MKNPYHSPRWAKWIGVGILIVLLFIIFVGFSHSEENCSINIQNHSLKAKIYYWVHWKNPVDAEGNPFIDSEGRIIEDMQIMGGELGPGKEVTSTYGRRTGEYYLMWTEASGCGSYKRTDFTIELGVETYRITVYSSGE